MGTRLTAVAVLVLAVAGWFAPAGRPPTSTATATSTWPPPPWLRALGFLPPHVWVLRQR